MNVSSINSNTSYIKGQNPNFTAKLVVDNKTFKAMSNNLGLADPKAYKKALRKAFENETKNLRGTMAVTTDPKGSGFLHIWSSSRPYIHNQATVDRVQDAYAKALGAGIKSQPKARLNVCFNDPI